MASRRNIFCLQGLQIEEARQSNSTQEQNQAKAAAKKAKKQRQRASRQQAHQSHQLSKQAQPSQQALSLQQTSFSHAAQPDDLAQAPHHSHDLSQRPLLLSQTEEQNGIKISNNMRPGRSASSAAVLDEPFDVQPSPPAADMAASEQGQVCTLADQLPSNFTIATEGGNVAEKELQQLGTCSTAMRPQSQTGTGQVECCPGKQESDAFLQQLVCCPITQVRSILSNFAEHTSNSACWYRAAVMMP